MGDDVPLHIGDCLEPLFRVSNSSTLKETLEVLITVSRTPGGRLELASLNVLPTVLELCQSVSPISGNQHCLLSLRLLRNLCAGDIVNQNSFIELKGVETVSNIMSDAVLFSDLDKRILRAGLQVLANVSLAGEEHQQAIWHQFFPDEFVALATSCSQETCDPLCMIIYTCCNGNPGMILELCGDRGLPILTTIVQTVSVVGFKEDWLKLLLSRACLEEIYFPQLFFRLYGDSDSKSDINSSEKIFSTEQACLLRIVSEILSEQLCEIVVPTDFALCIFEIFKRSVGVIDFGLRGDSGLPTGSTAIDVLGYSLTILKDMCARDYQVGPEEVVDVVEKLLSYGLLEFLLCLLRDLEPPAIIRKVMERGGNQETNVSSSAKLCPYRGFRRDIVAVIGNCAFRRKYVQDQVRQMDGILLMLQQCVTDEENPFLREWGIWSARNLLEGNTENQQFVEGLEIQGSVDVPELDGLRIKVVIDQKTRHPKLVNVP